MSPRIDILVPSFNHGRFLPACLEGVLGQTLEDWRLLLIDDGSRDDSVEIARGFAARDSRIAVLQNETNLGTYGTQARGLALTDAPLVAVLNSDDVWAPTKLARQIELLDGSPEATFAYVLGGLIDDAGRPIPGEDVHADWPRDERQETLPRLLFENRILASGVMFRRPGLRFNPACRYSGDWVALLERAFAGPAVCVPEPLTFWRQHGDNTYVASPRQMREEIRVREGIERRAGEWQRSRFDWAVVRRGLGLNALRLMALDVYFYNLAAARRTGLAAVRYGNRGAIKRLAGLGLGAERARRHLWPRLHGAPGDLSPTELRALLDEAPPVEIQLEARPDPTL